MRGVQDEGPTSLSGWTGLKARMPTSTFHSVYRL